MSRILLHTCCGPCATHCIRHLKAEGHEPVLFFSNSNIAPAAEYTRRRDAAQTLASAERIEFIEDPPDHDRWLLEAATGFEREPEGGARCARCFRFSFTRTVEAIERSGCQAFTTTLSVSPHKRSALLFEAARGVDSARFLPYDFKKQNGFQQSLRLAAELGLYRQTYCGCEFSKKEIDS